MKFAGVTLKCTEDEHWRVWSLAVGRWALLVMQAKPSAHPAPKRIIHIDGLQGART